MVEKQQLIHLESSHLVHCGHQADQCTISLLCRGTERAELEEKSLHLQLDLRSHPHYGHKLWLETERMRSWTQAAEKNFL